ncbi:hypothetical protein [Chitinophaga sp. LS1]|uniref:hypothetical protein n=1 Tax=Chitinophaga sp. LS1 TaxID=3051176 RepID=UPI002AABE758|nr:hypothetical protein [Chitinophaga sp. LS1]WPV69206.1 hypothetical protein QQL36_10790 [Chitinophaga sp. LS1]
MSHMIYEDYRKSALKHLKTCEFMLENLDKIPAVDNLDGLSKEEWKNHVLRNIFYLTGYAAEGIINYCIYKLAYGIRGNNLDIERLNMKLFKLI